MGTSETNLAGFPSRRHVRTDWIWLAAFILVLVPVAVATDQGYLNYLILCSSFLVGIAAFVRFFKADGWGITLILVSCLILPFQIGEVPLVAIFVILFSGIFVLKVMLNRRILKMSRTMWAALIFMIVATLAFIAGQFPWHPTPPAPILAQLAALAIFWISGACFLLVAFQLKDINSLRKLTWLFLCLSAILAVSYPLSGLNAWIDFLRGGMGSLFWVWFSAIALSQAIFNKVLSKKIRLLLVALVVFAVVLRTLVMTAQVSGWMPTMVAVGIILVMSRPIKTVLLLLPVGMVLLWHLELIVTTLWSAEEYSVHTRLEALWILLEVAKVNPLLGVGPANYYYYTELFPLTGWYVRFNSHNAYLDILAQTGILGLLSFLWFAFENARKAWRLRLCRLTGFERGYVYACLAGLGGTLASGLLGDWFLPFVYHGGLDGLQTSLLPWFFLGGLVALSRIINDTAMSRTRVSTQALTSHDQVK